MSKETFDFSEALRRMKEGKKVIIKPRNESPKIYCIAKDKIGKEYLMCFLGKYAYSVSHINDDLILATDWEEVNG